MEWWFGLLILIFAPFFIASTMVAYEMYEQWEITVGRGKNKKKRQRAKRAEQAKHDRHRHDHGWKQRHWKQRNDMPQPLKTVVPLRVAIDGTLLTDAGGVAAAGNLLKSFEEGRIVHLIVLCDHIQDDKALAKFEAWALRCKIPELVGHCVFNIDGLSAKFFVVSHLQQHSITAYISSDSTESAKWAQSMMSKLTIHDFKTWDAAGDWLDSLDATSVNVVDKADDAFIVIQTGKVTSGKAEK